jgi:hypothetical protein
MLRVAALAVALTVSAAGGAGPIAPDRAPPTTVGYRTGLELDRYDPPVARDPPPAVIVLIHGCCGDRRDLSALARALARRGAVVGNADVHAIDEGGGWPATYDDVVCAVAWAHETAASNGGSTEVVLLGWGEGALVASAVTLGWGSFSATADGCVAPIPRTGPATVIGISGHYGWRDAPPPSLVDEATRRWFGTRPEDDPEAWHRGSAAWWAARADPTREHASFLLLDTAGRPATLEFEDALRAGWVDVETMILPAGLHGELIHTRGALGRQALELISDRVGLQSG